MENKKIRLDKIVALTKELFHAHYAGKSEAWFSYLTSDSIFLGTGSPILIGKNSIENHFKVFLEKYANIIQENYFSTSLGEQTVQVCGQIILHGSKGVSKIINHFTVNYRLIGNEIKILHIHNSYEYMLPNEEKLLTMDGSTMQSIRSLLLEHPPGQRIAIRSGTQTAFVDLHTVLYVQSLGRKTEFVCIDKIISCNSSISEIAKELPEIFYPLHRGYLVNTLYITAIRRFEAVLISGITLPIPALTYQQAKKDLHESIQGRMRLNNPK